MSAQVSGEAEGVTLFGGDQRWSGADARGVVVPAVAGLAARRGTSSYSREGWKRHPDARRSGPLERGHGRPLWRREGRRVGFGG